METRIGPQTPYEVYCYECRVTFPVGTSRCVHCGRPIGGAPSLVRGPLAGLPRMNPPGANLPGAPPGNADEAVDPMLVARKFGGAGLWLLIALGAALSRYCGGS